MKSPRIGIFAHTFDSDRGGVPKVAALMARVLTDEAHTFEALSTCPSASAMKARTFGGSSLKMACWTLLHRSRFTHVLFDSPNRARLGALLPHRVRRLTFIHGIEVWENARPDWLKAISQSDIVVSNSQYTADRARRLHPDFPSVEVCPLATLDEQPPLSVAPPSNRPPHVLCVARMAAEEDYKGHRELIAAWPAVRAVIPEAELHFIGEGDLRPALESAAREQSVPGGIHFLGRVSDEALDRAYRHARIFAMPSRGEGFGLVYIEAMRHQLPVIASVHDAAPEVVEDGVTGLCVDLDEGTQALASAIIRLLQSPEEADSFGIAGRARWKARFTYAAFRERFRNPLERLLQG